MKQCYARLLDETVEKYGENLALVDVKRQLTFRELRDEADSLAASLLDAGVKKGDHVALWAFSTVRWMVAFYAIVKTGAIAVFMDHGVQEDTAAELMRFTDASFLIFGANRATQKDPRVGFEVAQKAGISPERVMNLDEWDPAPISPERKRQLDEIKAAQDGDEASVFIFTSGSTGKPKVVMLSDYCIISNCHANSNLATTVDRTRILLGVPLYHCYGFAITIVDNMAGRTIYLPPMLLPAIMADWMEKYKIEAIASVTALYLALMEVEGFETKVVPYMKLGAVGGGFTSEEQLIMLEKRYKNAIFLNGYGQTECSTFITTAHSQDSVRKRVTTVGHKDFEGNLYIWDSVRGVLPVGEIGEVLVQGSNVMKGYYKVPRQEQPIDSEGRLHTGDLGRLDEEGFLTLTGKIKDLIIRAGENIAPAEVEEKLLALPQVVEAKVIGLPDPLTGERVEACLVVSDPESFSVTEALSLLKKTLPASKLPAHLTVYPDFPRLDNGKTDVLALKKDLQERLG